MQFSHPIGTSILPSTHRQLKQSHLHAQYADPTERVDPPACNKRLFPTLLTALSMSFPLSGIPSLRDSR